MNTNSEESINDVSSLRAEAVLKPATVSEAEHEVVRLRAQLAEVRAEVAALRENWRASESQWVAREREWARKTMDVENEISALRKLSAEYIARTDPVFQRAEKELDELELLRAEVAALREDKERLDWLSVNVHSGNGHRYNPLDSDVFAVWPAGKKLRDAIDAARAELAGKETKK